MSDRHGRRKECRQMAEMALTGLNILMRYKDSGRNPGNRN